MAVLTRTEDALEITLKGSDNFKEDLAKIKAIPGRRYDGERKVWLLPNDVTVAERVMQTIRPAADPGILQWVRHAKEEQADELTTPIPDDAEIQLPWADALMAHQRAAVEFLVHNPRALVADDMGLGKTVQSLAATEETKLRNPELSAALSITVCPGAAMGGWQATAEGWLGYPAVKVWDGMPLQMLDAKTKKKRDGQLATAIDQGGLLVANWEKLRIQALVEALVDVDKLAVYGDEIHRAKNRKAKQTQGLWALQAPIQHGLSGTPIMNSPDELWSILRWLFPKEYNRTGRDGAVAYWRFFDQYVEHYEGPWGKVITGVRNPDALRFELKGRLIRRTKRKVLDLPGKIRQLVPVELGTEQRKLYAEAEKKLWLEVAQDAKAGDKAAMRLLDAGFNAPTMLYQLPNGAARTVRLRQVASTPATLGGKDVSAKLDAAQEIILDAQPKQFVFFAEFRETCIAMVRRLEDKGVTAKTFLGGDDYTALEAEFQAGEIGVLCCTIEAGSLGINLTAADTAIFAERHWVPAINGQAEDRLDRTGQVNKVTILILEAKDTVDVSKVRPANDLKSLVVAQVLEQDHVEEETL